MVCVAWMYVIFGLSRTQKSVSSALMGGFAPSSGEFDYHRFCSESLSNYDAGTSQVMTLGVPDRGKFAAHASLLLEENRSYHIREHASNCLRFPSSGPKEIQGPWDVLQRYVQIMIEDSIIYRNQPEKNGLKLSFPQKKCAFPPCVRQWLANGFILKTSWHG